MAHQTVNSHCPLRTGQSDVLSGVPTIIQVLNSALSGFCAGEGLPQANLAPLVEGAPDSLVHTGQSGAPRSGTLVYVFYCFSNRFSF
jgi:hypothetical protein